MKTKREDPRSLFTRTMLKNSCTALLIDKNIEQIMINELCSEAGVNRSTFYRYYPDIYALREDLEDDFCHIFTDHLFDNEQDEPLSFLRSLLTSIKSMNPNLLSIMKQLDNHRILTNIMNFHRPFFFEKAKEHHLTLNDQELEYFFQALLASLSSVVITWIKNGMSESPAEVCAMIQKIGFLRLC